MEGKDLDSSESRDQSNYPEVVSFTGVGRSPLKQIHLIALSLVALGVIFAYVAPPGGYLLLLLFILIAAGYDLIFIRKSQRPVKISLYLRTNPVEAQFGEKKIGEILTGAIADDMEKLNELGFRPAPNRDLMIWTFDSPEDARFVAKRLLEYLPRDE